MKNIFPISFLLTLILFSSCKEPEEVQKELIRPVKTIQVQGFDELMKKSFPGVSKEAREVELSFRVAGPLVQYNVNEVGQTFKKGALIAQIDPRDFQVELNAREARFVQAKAEKERFEVLYKKGSVAKNDLDTKEAAFREAKAEYENAQNEMNDTRVHAPFTGYVGSKLVENYQEVQAKQVIMTLVDLALIEVQLYIPENLAVNFKKFDEYMIEFETYPGKVFGATIKEMGKTPEAEGFPLTLYLDHKNVEGGEFVIGSGFTCKVNIKLKGDNEETVDDDIIIPLTAIFEGNADNKTAVWVLDEGSMTVSKQYVTIGDLYSNDAVHIASGLAPGDLVVTAGVFKLTEGQKVKFLQDKL